MLSKLYSGLFKSIFYLNGKLIIISEDKISSNLKIYNCKYVLLNIIKSDV